MIDRLAIQQEVEQMLEGTDKFVVDVRVKSGNRITVLLDSDTSITIDDCVAVTRRIESVFNRETEDYDLTVSSAGIDQPYRKTRQYIKNVGREVEVTLTDGTVIKGKLIAADDSAVTIETRTKVKKTVTVENHEIPYSGIKQTKEVISFK